MTTKDETMFLSINFPLLSIHFIHVQRIECNSISRCSSLIQNHSSNLNRCQQAWQPSNLSWPHWGQSLSPWSTTTRMCTDLFTQISSGNWCLVAAHLHLIFLRMLPKNLSLLNKPSWCLTWSKEFCYGLEPSFWVNSISSCTHKLIHPQLFRCVISTASFGLAAAELGGWGCHAVIISIHPAAFAVNAVRCSWELENEHSGPQSDPECNC